MADIMCYSAMQGRGTVITGRVEQGIVKVGDDIELVGINGTPTKTVVTGEPKAPALWSREQHPRLCSKIICWFLNMVDRLGFCGI